METHGRGILIPFPLIKNVAGFKLNLLPPVKRRQGVEIDELSLNDVLRYWDAVYAQETRGISAQA